eukprot:363326-Chlamydomonas_euryale.AAC.10
MSSAGLPAWHSGCGTADLCAAHHCPRQSGARTLPSLTNVQCWAASLAQWKWRASPPVPALQALKALFNPTAARAATQRIKPAVRVMHGPTCRWDTAPAVCTVRPGSCTRPACMCSQVLDPSSWMVAQSVSTSTSRLFGQSFGLVVRQSVGGRSDSCSVSQSDSQSVSRSVGR